MTKAFNKDQLDLILYYMLLKIYPHTHTNTSQKRVITIFHERFVYLCNIIIIKSSSSGNCYNINVIFYCQFIF